MIFKFLKRNKFSSSETSFGKKIPHLKMGKIFFKFDLWRKTNSSIFLRETENRLRLSLLHSKGA